MDADAARTFLEDNRRAVLATFRSSGTLQMSPVLAVVDGDGKVVVSSRETAYKTRNLRRDPRVSLCVFTDRFFGNWVQIDGTAEIVSLPEAIDGLIDYYRRAAGEHPNWDEYREAMNQERRVLIRVDIDRAGPHRAG